MLHATSTTNTTHAEVTLRLVRFRVCIRAPAPAGLAGLSAMRTRTLSRQEACSAVIGLLRVFTTCDMALTLPRGFAYVGSTHSCTN